MRTNIVIDEDLIESALQATGLTTKRGVVELGLQTLVRLHKQKGIRKLRGKLQWEGDLDAMRTDRSVSAKTDDWVAHEEKVTYEVDPIKQKRSQENKK